MAADTIEFAADAARGEGAFVLEGRARDYTWRESDGGLVVWNETAIGLLPEWQSLSFTNLRLVRTDDGIVPTPLAPEDLAPLEIDRDGRVTLDAELLGFSNASELEAGLIEAWAPHGTVGVEGSGIVYEASETYRGEDEVRIAFKTPTGETVVRNFAVSGVRVEMTEIDAPLAQRGALGEEVDVDLGRMFHDTKDGQSLVFSATDLPPGLSLDPITGRVTGTIAADARVGDAYAVTLEALSGQGQAVRTTFDWTVREPVASDELGRALGATPEGDDDAPHHEEAADAMGVVAEAPDADEAPEMGGDDGADASDNERNVGVAEGYTATFDDISALVETVPLEIAEVSRDRNEAMEEPVRAKNAEDAFETAPRRAGSEEAEEPGWDSASLNAPLESDAGGDTAGGFTLRGGVGGVQPAEDDAAQGQAGAANGGQTTVIAEGARGQASANAAGTGGGGGTNINTAPELATITGITVSEDTALENLDILGTARDRDGDELVLLSADAENGTVTINADGTVNYVPNTDYSGLDVITYTLTDGNGGTALGTIGITVVDVNDAPDTGQTGDRIVGEDTDLDIDVLGVATDIDGDALEVLSATAGNGSVTINGDGTLTYTPDQDYFGPDTITYTVTDGRGGQDEATIDVVVTPTNDAPRVLDVPTQSVDEDGRVTIDVLPFASDVEGDALTLDTATVDNGSVQVLGNQIVYTPDENATENAVVTYTISDGRGGTVTGTVAVTVNPINDAPELGTVEGGTVVEDGTITGIDVLSSASDVENDSLTVVDARAANGTVSINADGTLDYTPRPDFAGEDTITYTVSDGVDEATGTVSISVSPINDAPVAGPSQSLAVNEDETLGGIDVLSAASDVDGDALVVRSATAANGTVVIEPDGTLTYTPDADFNALDTITYELSDGTLTTTGTVEINVQPLNDAPDAGAVGSVFVAEDGSLAGIDVLGAATDADGDQLSVSAAGATHGTVTIATDGTLTYTPDTNYAGADTITYTVSDGKGGTDSGAVTVNVGGENDAPVAGTPQSVAVDEDGTLTGLDVLSGATDVDGDALTVMSASAANGTVTINADGTLDYRPDADFHGADTITYIIDDGMGGSDTGTVNVTVRPVEDAPDAGNPPAVTVAEDASASGIDVLSSATDADGDAVSVGGAVATHGTVEVAGDGTLSYTPDPDYSGADTITYTLVDAKGTETVATLAVEVTRRNDAPETGAPTGRTGDEDAIVRDIDVLSAATDADGDALSVSAATAANGTVTINADGTLDYRPNGNFNGTDIITYTIDDGFGGTATGTVTVEVAPVNDAPVAGTVPDQNVAEDGAIRGLDLASGATDIEGDAVVVLGASALNGSVTLNPDGTVDYVPVADFHGTDTITYTLSDGNGGTARGTVSVTVDPVNDAPVTGPVTDQNVAEDGTIAAIDVLSAASDLEGDALSVEAASALNGTVAINADGTLAYTPAADFHGTDTITYTVSDGNDTATGTVTVTVDPRNDAPSAGAPAPIGVDEDETSIIDVLSDASDVDGDALTVTQASALNGTVAINADGTLAYTPKANYNGSDTITYTVADPSGATDTAELAITVANINDAPEANAPAGAAGDEDAAVRGIDVLSAATDEEGDAITVTAASALHGAVTINADGTLDYVPDTNFNGQDTITYTLSDGQSTAQGTVTVDIAPVNDDPDAGTAPDRSVSEDGSFLNIAVLDAASDVDGDTLSVSAASALHGTVSVNADGTLAYRPEADFHGTDTITYTVSDGQGGAVTASFTMTVVPRNDAPEGTAPSTQVTNEDTPIGAIDVLSGASDVEGDAISVASVRASSGTVTVNPDGTLSYTPNPDFNGTDTITYSLTDGQASTAFSFDIVINPVNDAPRDFTAASAGPIAEDVRKGTVVATLSAIDPDPTATGPRAGEVLYAIVDANGNAITHPVLEVNGDELVLRNQASFDFEIEPTITVRLSATDADGAVSYIEHTVTIADVAENIQLADGGATFTDTGVTELSVTGGTGGDDIVGSAGNDTIDGAVGDDLITGGAGADTIGGGAGFDTVSYADSQEGVRVFAQDVDAAGVGSPGGFAGTAAGNYGGTAEGDTLSGIEQIVGSDHDDLFFGATMGSNVQMGAGADVFDTDDFSVASDTVEGGAGNDSIITGKGDDTLSGGEGDDFLWGQGGNDTIDGGAGTDTIRLAGDRSDFTIQDNGDGSFTVYDMRTGGLEGTDTIRDVEMVQFDDQTMSVADVAVTSYRGTDGFDNVNGTAGNDVMYLLGDDDLVYGKEGDDTIHGGAGNDAILGGAGDDALFGGEGRDFILGGEGADHIDGGAGVDMVSFENATAGVAVAFDDVDESGINGAYGNAAAGGLAGEAAGDTYAGIEEVRGSIHADAVYGAAGGTRANLGAGDDAFDNDATNVAVDTVRGEGGNDTIFTGGGDDVIHGGAGDDLLAGEDGNDTVDGGAGTDTYYLIGNRADFEVTDNGDGSYTITDTRIGGTSGVDTVRGIELIRFLDGTVTVQQAVGTQFGTAGNDTLTGTVGDDILIGLDGDDTLIGMDGDDLLEGGAGADFLNGGNGMDTVDYSNASGSVVVLLENTTSGGVNGQYVNAAAGGRGHEAEGDTYSGIDGVIGSDFDDLVYGAHGGTTAYLGAGNDVFDNSSSHANRDRVFGEDGDDIIILGGGNGDYAHGGAGNDILRGDWGNNTLVGGDGIDTVWYGNARQDYAINDNGDGTFAVFDGTDADTISEVEFIRFADQTVMIGGAGGRTHLGGTSDETVFGTANDDGLNGGDGNDTLYGGGGNDRLSGGKDEDLLYGEAGDDTLHGNDNKDTLHGGAGNDRLDGGADDDILYGESGNDTLIGGLGNDDLFGGSGNDVLMGGDGDNELAGGAGDDTLDGGIKQNAKAYYSGNGADYHVADNRDGTFTVIDLRPGSPDGTDTITNIEKLVFADGEVKVVDAAVQLGTGNNDTITGTQWNDTIRARDGRDEIDGREGNDVIDAGADFDVIIGGAGDDIIHGGVDGQFEDTAVYSGNRADYDVHRNPDGSHTVTDLRPGSPDGTDTLTNIRDLRFADQTVALNDAVTAVSPIVLDLDRSGAIEVTGETTARDKSGITEVGETVQFDMDGDGEAETIEWIAGGGDAFLVDNRDGMAATDMDGTRLFGDQGGQFTHGYEQLAGWDVDGDGTVAGTETEGLSLWVDDGNAIVDDGELVPLSQMGIEALSVVVEEAFDANGNTLQQSVAETADGSSIMTEDVWFARAQAAQEPIETFDPQDDMAA